MRVTLNVLYREAIRILTEKGYKITKSYTENKVSNIWCKYDTELRVAISLEKKERSCIYTIATNTSEKTIAPTKNYLANLRLFIRKEL